MHVPQNTKNRVKLPYDPAIPPLGIHLEKIIIQKDTVPPPHVHRSTIYNSQNMEAT